MAIFSGLSLTALLFLAAVALFAGLVRGFSGFGAALIFTPLAAAIVSPRMAAPVLLVVDAVATLPLVVGAWRHSERSAVATMALGALAGVPLGAFVLTVGDPTAIRWALSLIVFAVLALLMSGWRYKGKPLAPVTVGVGGAAGFLSGFAQMSGPPVIAYWLGGTAPAAIVRANIILFFFATDILAAVTYTADGLLTAKVFAAALIVGPVYGLGLWFGAHMFSRANETTYRRVAYTLIALAAVLSLPLWENLR